MADTLITDQEIAILCDVLEGWGANLPVVACRRSTVPYCSTYATALAEVAVGQRVDLLRPAAPAPVLTAVKFMYGGAAISAACLIAALPFIGDIHGRRSRAPPHRDPAHHHAGDSRRPGPGRPVAVDGAGGRPGRNWARILSTVLFVLATLSCRESMASLQVLLAVADLADRPRRGVAAVAPGLQRVLQVGQGGAAAAAAQISGP